jgi:hypothetical protein
LSPQCLTFFRRTHTNPKQKLTLEGLHILHTSGFGFFDQEMMKNADSSFDMAFFHPFCPSIKRKLHILQEFTLSCFYFFSMSGHNILLPWRKELCQLIRPKLNIVICFDGHQPRRSSFWESSPQIYNQYLGKPFWNSKPKANRHSPSDFTILSPPNLFTCYNLQSL